MALRTRSRMSSYTYPLPFTTSECLPLILHSFTFSRTCSTVRCVYRSPGAPLTLFPSCDFHDALLKSHSWATFALHSIPHRWNIGLNGLAVSTAAFLRSESRQNNAIVGFSTIRGGILQIHISGFETLDEIVRRVGARNGALRTFIYILSNLFDSPATKYSFLVSTPTEARAFSSGLVRSNAITSVASGLAALMAVALSFFHVTQRPSV